jgi:serine phosphatase RsbU (regulator of sigma subunit)
MFGCLLRAQPRTVRDSLLALTEESFRQTVRAEALCRLCDLKMTPDAREALSMGLRGLEIALESEESALTALCYRQLAALADRQDHVADARAWYLKSLNHYRHARDWAGAFDVERQLASLAERQMEWEQALSHLYQALLLARRSQQADSSSLLLRLALNELELGHPDRAHQYCQRGLHAARAAGDSSQIAYAYSVEAEIEQAAGHLDRALANYRRSAKLYQRLGLDTNYATVLHNMALTLKAFGRLAEARPLLYECTRIWTELGQMRKAGYGHRHLASLLLAEGRSLNAAYEHAEAARQAFTKTKDSVGLSDNYLLQARIDSSRGHLSQAYRHLQTYIRLQQEMSERKRLSEALREEERYRAERQLIDLERNDEQQRQALRWRNMALAGGTAGLAALLWLLVSLWRARIRSLRVTAKLRALHSVTVNQKTEIEAQNQRYQEIHAEMLRTLKELYQQRDSLSEQNRQIEDSFLYASRIQRAILPDERTLNQHLPKHFIIYMPRDIVSGDFYWLARLEGRTILAVVDCTGHGVPGAFMSMVGANLLYQIIEEHGITKPHAILASLDRRINQTLRQTETGEPGDGMDVALIELYDADEQGARRVEFAGANRPLLVLRGNQVDEYRSGTFSCGGFEPMGKTFPTVSLTLQAGNRIFLYTDGITDQFGKEDVKNPTYRKMGREVLKRWILETYSMSLQDQGESFRMFFNVWKGGHRQIDDVLMFGLEI